MKDISASIDEWNHPKRRADFENLHNCYVFNLQNSFQQDVLIGKKG